MIDKLKSFKLFAVYLIGFLFSLSVALPNYVNSSFLGTVMDKRFVGLIFAVEAFLAIVGFLLMPRILRRLGVFLTTMGIILGVMVSFLGLVFWGNLFGVAFFMIINLSLLTYLSFTLDIFLEGYSVDTSTGKTRGIYLTFVNLAWLIAPYLTGLIIINNDYWKIYLAGFILLLPVIIILQMSLSNFKDSEYKVVYPFKTIRSLWKNKNILNIFLSSFALNFFYCWMTIYTPIYLNTNLGFSWSEIGIIFFVMLLPFVFVQLPAGKLADSRLGEKEMLCVGFILMALSTMVMFFITGKSILVWSLILFGTRIGAAIVEVMCDVYFFKKVDNKDANLIGLYRMARPFAYIVGPILAILILSVPNMPMKGLFLVLGFAMFFGLKFGLSIKDTK